MFEIAQRLMKEGLLSRCEAAKMFGSRHSGATTHLAVITRRCQKGDLLPDSVLLLLEHVRVANWLVTSQEAVIHPAARAGTLRLYDRRAVAMVRYELNLIVRTRRIT